MNTVITVAAALLTFGFLVLIHELGHYTFARIFKVSISEFSVGMGPRLLWYDSKKTGIRYSLAMLPIGGYVEMAGENGESEDPDSFDRKPAWQRFIITAAGATVNIVFGFLVMMLLTSLNPILTTKVGAFVLQSQSGFEISSAESGLRVNDTIISVDGKRVVIGQEMSYEIMRRGNEPVDLVVLRDGEKITLYDVVFPTTEEQGQSFGQVDFLVRSADKSFGTVISAALRNGCLIVRMCWESLYDLITGRYTLAAVSGPVGISSAIGTAVNQGLSSVLYIVTLISINLGVMNLLPIPALDGGRLITVLFEMITKKRVPQKIEAMINGIGLIVLLLLSFAIMIKDVVQLFIG